MSQRYLEIISINGQASIQDLGRLNSQHLGFSASGAADEFAFLSANKLIANKLAAHKFSVEHQHNIPKLKNKQSNCAAIEITLGQVIFEVKAACIIAVAGADCQAKINDVTINNWQCRQLQAGDIIDFSIPKSGLHSYLAIFGGFTCHREQQPWLGSFSQTRNEMALGFTGELLTVGSKLYFSAQNKSLTAAAAKKTSKLQPPKANKPPTIPTLFYAKQKLTLRLMPSTLFFQMTSKEQQQFLSTEYVISPDSNRMGYRLSITHPQTSSSNKRILSEQLRSRCLLSMPVTYGMVQFPDNEQPIILMKERQTMGGYPVLGTVMQTDLFRLSQMRPGEKVTFILINHQKAQQQLRAFYQKLNP